MKKVWIVWMRDIDFQHKLCSVWITKKGADAEKFRLQDGETEVTYYVKEQEVNR